MTTFNCDKNNNLIVDSRITIVDEIEAIKQDIKHLLLMFKTEYPFNLSEGLPWYDLTLKNNKAVLTHAISDRILQDKRIRNILKMDISFKDRTLKIEATLRTAEGAIINV